MSAKSRCLITGASGFVGGAVAASFAERGFDVAAVRHTNPLRPAVVERGVEELACDLADERAALSLVRRIKPDCIIHAAALANTGECERDPERALAANVIATENILRAAELLPVSTLITLSTDMVFDGAGSPLDRFTEDMRPQPASIYGRTKYQAECTVFGSTLPLTVVRMPLLYGPGTRNFLGWLRRQVADGEVAPVFVDEFRTPLAVSDVSDLLAAILREAKPPRLLHAGGPTRVSRLELAEVAAEVFGFSRDLLRPVSRSDVPSPYPRSPDLSLSNALAEELLGRSFLSLREGLERAAREDSWW